MQKDIDHLRHLVNAILSNKIFDSTLNFSTGIVHDVFLTSLLLSWNIIYDFPYNHVTTVEEFRPLKSQYEDQIIVQ